MPTHISAADLRKADACADQLQQFVALFGEEPVEVTEEACVAVAEKFDVYWAVTRLLRGEALAKYERQKAPLWAEYKRQTASLLAEYKRQEAPMLAEYERQRALLWAEYARQRAQVFARCYRGMP